MTEREKALATIASAVDALEQAKYALEDGDHHGGAFSYLDMARRFVNAAIDHNKGSAMQPESLSSVREDALQQGAWKPLPMPERDPGDDGRS